MDDNVCLSLTSVGDQNILKLQKMDEVDITNHLPPGFFETIRSTKWTERRDILSAFIDNLSRYSRIDPTIKYNEIFAELKLVGTFYFLIPIRINLAKFELLLA